MKMFSVTGLACLGLALLAAPVQAWGWRHRDSGSADCGTCVVYVEKKVTCLKPIWKEKEVPVTVTRVVCKTVVEKVKQRILVPEYKDVVQTRMVNTLVPRVVERDVPTCRTVPITCVDPCTGCTYTVCKRETVLVKVQQTVCDCLPVKKEFTVKVCSYREAVREVDVPRLVPETVKQVVITRQRYCEWLPFETVVRVPVRVPCQPVCAPVACP
jgi:hypothetical protein